MRHVLCPGVDDTAAKKMFIQNKKCADSDIDRSGTEPPWKEEDGRLIPNLRIDKTPPRLPHANQYTLPPSAPNYRTFQLMELPSSIPPGY